MEVPESNRRGSLRAKHPFQRYIVGIGPKVLVIVSGVGMDDEQFVGWLRDAQRKWQFAQPGEPLFAEFAASPRETCFLALEALLTRHREVAVGIATHALRADLRETLKNFSRPRSVGAQVARGNDCVGAPLRREVGKTGIKRDEVSVDIGKNRYSHALDHDRATASTNDAGVMPTFVNS